MVENGIQMLYVFRGKTLDDCILGNVKAKKVNQRPETRTCDNLASPIWVDNQDLERPAQQYSSKKEETRLEASGWDTVYRAHKI
jgi:hypothetical protein